MARKRSKIKKNNSRGMGLITMILTVMLLIVGVHSRNLWHKQMDLQAEKTELAAQIESEEKRTQELEQLRRYVQTDSYAQEVASDKLGLVHEGEIVFEIQK